MDGKRSKLSEILDEWQYGNGDNVRRVGTTEGREVLQVRLPLGIEQYELHGRPDGARPEDHESWFHYYSERAKDEQWDFVLAEDDFEKLKDECLLYYYRYLLFFQIQEYRYCARDTLRNLRVLDFVTNHSETEDSASLEKYRPYILRMHLMARALDKVQRGDEVHEALSLIESGLEQIRDLPDLENNKVFEHEKRTSLKVLEQLHTQLSEMIPPDPDMELRRQLEEAIQEEDYESAAKLRDQLEDVDDHPEG